MVLFAALTYAITQSNRGNAVSMSREIADNRAAELVNYGNAMKYATNSLILRGCDETQINYANIYYPAPNVNAPANGNCDIFGANGGGVSPRLFGSEYLDSTQTNAAYLSTKGSLVVNGCNRVQYLGTDVNGLGSVDALGIFTAVNPEICKAINKRYNINSPNYTPISTNLYGCWSGTPIITDGFLVTAMTDLAKKGGGCYYVGQYGGYTSYFVPLMER